MWFGRYCPYLELNNLCEHLFNKCIFSQSQDWYLSPQHCSSNIFFFWQKIVTAELMVLTEIKQEYQHIKALSLNSVKLSHFSSLLFMKEFFENHVPRKLLWYCD